MVMNTLTRTITLFISQGACSGRFPIAPGTAGTLVGVLLYWCMKGLSPVWYGALLLLIILIGTWSAGRTEVLLGQKDSPSIVIDEIAGYLIAMFLVPSGWWFVAAGFLLFRVFDIMKPYPLKRFETAPGGLGVMLDDIGAGIYTNLVLQAAVLLFFPR
jgi:phosphatidylglycerophosphatase A